MGRGVKKDLILTSYRPNIPIYSKVPKNTTIYLLFPHPLELSAKVPNDFCAAKFNGQFLVLVLSAAFDAADYIYSR